VRIERLHPGGGGRDNGVWRSVDVHTPDEPHQYLRLHSTSECGAQSINYADNSVSTKWAFAKAGVGIRQAVGQWSDELRLAAHASLRRRANVFRTRHSSELPRLHGIWTKPRKAMRDFLCLQAGSCMGWWWRLADVHSARRLQKARIGEWGNEDTYRRMPRKKTRCRPMLPRLEDPAQRVCYLCKHATAAQRRPETVAHLFTECAHVQMVECRRKVRVQLLKIAQSASEIGGGGVAAPLVPDFHDEVVQAAAQVGGGLATPPVPDFEDPQVLYAILMGCTSLGSTEHEVAFKIAPGVARPACAWLRWLISFWLDSYTRGDKQSEKERRLAHLGGDVARCIAGFSLHLHSVRRRVLADDAGFKRRSLDPPHAAQSSAKPARVARSRVLRSAAAQL